ENPCANECPFGHGRIDALANPVGNGPLRCLKEWRDGKSGLVMRPGVALRRWIGGQQNRKGLMDQGVMLMLNCKSAKLFDRSRQVSALGQDGRGAGLDVRVVGVSGDQP